MAIRQRTSAAKDVIVLTSLVPLPTWLTREDGWVQHVWQSHGLSATSPSCFDPPDSHGHGMAYTSCWSCLYYELWGTCHHSKSKKTKHKALAGVDCEWLSPQHIGNCIGKLESQSAVFLPARHSRASALPNLGIIIPESELLGQHGQHAVWAA